MTPNSKSKVFKWAETRKQQVQPNTPSWKILSDATIHNVTRFVLLLKRSIPANKMNPLFNGASRAKFAYSNDSSLFELGCYVYFRIDLWHVENKFDESREKVLKPCLDEFIKVFEDVLGFCYGNDILQSRFNFYGKLNREKHGELIDFFLAQLMIQTRNNVLPEVHAYDEYPIAKTEDYTEAFFLKIGLEDFRKVILPAILQNVKNIYESKQSS
ncbi:MAG: hypothetical protein ABR913_05580 [Sedimentisphaerales bacterium]|jgi:hypothetical protein